MSLLMDVHDYDSLISSLVYLLGFIFLLDSFSLSYALVINDFIEEKRPIKCAMLKLIYFCYCWIL